MSVGHNKITGGPAWIVFVLSRICAWPVAFAPVQWVHRLLWHVMNRTSAGYLPVAHTGERRVIAEALTAAPDNRAAVVFDCGANLGDYTTVVMTEARRAGRTVAVHLFEPSRETANQLQERVAAFGGAAVVNRCAVAAVSGRQSIYFAWPGAGGTSLSPATSWIQGTGSFASSSEEIDAVSLDDFCEREGITHIDLLKLDIEGAELLALQGAERLIARGAISVVQFELGAAALPFGASLYQFWTRYASSFDFFLVLAHGDRHIEAYSPDLECFFGASTFVLRRRDARAGAMA